MAIQSDVWLWTREDVAERLQLSAELVEAIHEEGRLRGVRLGGELRFKPSDVQDFVHKLHSQGGPIMQA